MRRLIETMSLPPTTIGPEARDAWASCCRRLWRSANRSITSGVRRESALRDLRQKFCGLSTAGERRIPAAVARASLPAILDNRRLGWLDPHLELQLAELRAETNARRGGKDTCRAVLRNRMRPRSRNGTRADMRRFPYPGRRYLARARANIGLSRIASGMVKSTPRAMPAMVEGTPKRSPNNPMIGGATAEAPAVPV